MVSAPASPPSVSRPLLSVDSISDSSPYTTEEEDTREDVLRSGYKSCTRHGSMLCMSKWKHV